MSKSNGFSKLPHGFHKRIRELSESRLKVWLAHRCMEGKDGTSYPGLDTLVEYTGLNIHTVTNARKWLRDSGWLVSTRQIHSKKGRFSVPTEHTEVPPASVGRIPTNGGNKTVGAIPTDGEITKDGTVGGKSTDGTVGRLTASSPTASSPTASGNPTTEVDPSFEVDPSSEVDPSFELEGRKDGGIEPAAPIIKSVSKIISGQEQSSEAHLIQFLSDSYALRADGKRLHLSRGQKDRLRDFVAKFKSSQGDDWEFRLVCLFDLWVKHHPTFKNMNSVIDVFISQHDQEIPAMEEYCRVQEKDRVEIESELQERAL